MFKVKALMRGIYKHQRIEPGKVFMIKEAKEFSAVWMKSLDSKLDAVLKKPIARAAKPNKNAVEVIKPAPVIEAKQLSDVIDDENDAEIDDEIEVEDEGDITEDDEVEHAEASDDVI